jgi:ATP-dependent DNA helicase RecG
LKLILHEISKDKYVTTIDLARKLKVTRMTISRDIILLKEKRFLERIGPDKGGYWHIIENN